MASGAENGGSVNEAFVTAYAQLGDLVMLGADPLREAPHELARIPVVATVVGGEVVYQDAALG